MIAVPVAALGIAHLYGLIARHAKLNLFSNIGLALLLTVLLFMPNFLLRGIIQVQTPFGYFDEMMYQYYSMNQGDDEVIFSESERKFVTQVKEIVGRQSCLITFPTMVASLRISPMGCIRSIVFLIQGLVKTQTSKFYNRACMSTLPIKTCSKQ